MKIVASLLLLFVGLTAVAQRSSYHQNIDDDGKKLVIRIDQHKNGKEFHYSNTFDVRGMSDEEKSALVRRVLDSVNFEEKAPDRRAESAVWVEATAPKAEVATAASAAPFTKAIEEDTKAGRIKVIYQYMRDGEERNYERTINRKGRTAEEIQQLIEETEECLGLTVKNS
jgi:hypothetical protein